MESGNGINFTFWSKISTIEVCEAAAMMWGVDPRALLTGNVADSNGDFPDLSENKRRLMSAARAGVLNTSDDRAGTAPHQHTHVLTDSLIEWFRKNGYADLAHGLEFAGIAGVSPALAEARRRLEALRKSGGDCTFDTMSNEWRITGLKKLKEQETADGFGRTSEKTLRRDIVMAAEAEQEASRAGRPQGKFPSA